MQTKIFMQEKGRIAITLMLIQIGADACILIGGGDTPHIGAVGSGERKGTCCITTFQGHKESSVVERMTQKLASSGLFAHFAVSCGIHVDGITGDEIQTVLEICESLYNEMEKFLKSESANQE